MRIAVLHSDVGENPSPDDADTLVQARAVLGLLRAQGHQAQLLAVGPDLDAMARRVRRRGADMAFNLVESVGGGAEPACRVPEKLAAAGIPCTGSGSEALRATGNKIAAKLAMSVAGIPTPGWCYEEESELTIPKTMQQDGLCILKSVWEHGSLGMDAASVLPWGEMDAALAQKRQTYGGQWFAEAYVDGREFCVGLLELDGKPAPLPRYEIVFEQWGDAPRLVDYAAKWDEGSQQARNTVRRWDFPFKDCALLRRLDMAALACWRLFGLCGYARVDFRVDAAGIPWVIDVNANPCLSPDAGYAAQLAKKGLGLSHGVTAIVNAALRRSHMGAATAAAGMATDAARRDQATLAAPASRVA